MTQCTVIGWNGRRCDATLGHDGPHGTIRPTRDVSRETMPEWVRRAEARRLPVKVTPMR